MTQQLREVMLSRPSAIISCAPEPSGGDWMTAASKVRPRMDLFVSRKKKQENKNKDRTVVTTVLSVYEPRLHFAWLNWRRWKAEAALCTVWCTRPSIKARLFLFKYAPIDWRDKSQCNLSAARKILFTWVRSLHSSAWKAEHWVIIFRLV